MRIHDAYTRLDRTALRSERAVDSPRASRSAPSGDGVRIAVSAEARVLAERADLGANARVAALREQIASGGYHVDAGAIAARLVGGDE